MYGVTMKTRAALKTIALVIAIAAFSSVAKAEPREDRRRAKASDDQYVFVTGSMLPQRVEKKAVGTKTVSNLRIIGRDEIDGRGHTTTADILRNEPSLFVRGR